MGESAEKPVEKPIEDLAAPKPVIVGGVEEYSSSEEFQRAHAAGLKKQEEEKKTLKAMTERERLHAVIDKYIAKHSTVKAVRARIKENGQAINKHTLEIQFEVSDIIATELTKIKNELR